MAQSKQEYNFSFFCKKRSRKEGQLPRSEFTLFNASHQEQIKFMTEHNVSGNYPHGGIARKVKKCFLMGEERPKYALKVYKNRSYKGNKTYQLRMAMRAAYCERLLGRTSFTFRRNSKQYLMSEWLPGKCLIDVPQDEIVSIAMSTRILMALSLLKEVAILHNHGLIHSDIKPENIMFSGTLLHLFDFDGVQLKNEILSSAALVYTPCFLDAQTNYDLINNPDSAFEYFNFKSDIYAMGLTLCWLFPDVIKAIPCIIGTTVMGNKPSKFSFDGFKLVHQPQYAKHKALGDLILKLTTKNSCFDSMELVYNQLASLLNDSTIQPLKQRSKANLGKQAFDTIESELRVYNYNLKKSDSSDSASYIEEYSFLNTCIKYGAIALFYGASICIALKIAGRLSTNTSSSEPAPTIKP